ncbi:head decoration protein [Rhodococcus hoagii]|uniref:Head decoration protein n=1 Tax=Rhodococcus hoagii TaxID=43767 RepID=A0A9Q5EYH8_RHOHA|nr:head decoration protein [Prescottella equi]NKT77252.1 head decoration protein [Prescottella equi]NKZ81037.1 head decoration protein [Prescottella equi]
MTNIAVRLTGQFTAENRSYVYQDPGVWTRGSITLDIAKFDKAKHYPDGYIKSGTLLGKITATGLYGPYDKDATDGRQTPEGFLWDSTTVTSDRESAPLWFFGAIKASKLPANSGVTAEAKTALAAWFKFF